MKTLSSIHFLASLIAFASGVVHADEAFTLAGQMSAIRQDGSTDVRANLKIPSGAALQLQIKSRRTPSATDIACRVLWPKERQSEAFVIKADGTVATTSGPSKLTAAMFDSDLTFEDMADNFFAWKQQAIVGTEVVNKTPCTILESKPAGAKSSYTSVKSWIDPKRLITLKVVKFKGDKVIREIETTRVSTDDGRPMPSTIAVRTGPEQGAVTELEGTRRRVVQLSDSDFTTVHASGK